MRYMLVSYTTNYESGFLFYWVPISIANLLSIECFNLQPCILILDKKARLVLAETCSAPGQKEKHIEN